MLSSSRPTLEQQKRRRFGGEATGATVTRPVEARVGVAVGRGVIRVDCAHCRGDRRKMGYVEYDATDEERWELTVSLKRLGTRNAREDNGGTSRSETVLYSVAHGRHTFNGGMFGGPDPWEPDPQGRFTWPCPREGHRYDVTYAAIEAAVKRAMSNRQTSMILPGPRRVTPSR